MYPSKFYGTSKIHKLPVNGGINELPIRPIVSNLNTATYSLAKYLSKLLSPLRQSRNTVKSTKEFIEGLKQQKLSKEHKIVSFDVESCFTNSSLDRTIDMILKRIYEKNEILTSITKNGMNEVLILRTKYVHFTFESRTYVQTDGVDVGSPLGPVLAGIFMIKLENSLLPNLTKYITFWKRYVEDTSCFVKIGTTEFIISVLSSFDKIIQFMFDEENDETILFLDISVSRKRNDTTTTVYRKSTCYDIHLNWISFAPDTWKRGTLKTLVE